MHAVDQSVKNITDTYEQLGILNETLIIFSTDNGGNVDTGGCNWPLRGQKATTFEGGVRGVGFISGAGLAPEVRGRISQDLLSVADWLPTIVAGVAGLPLNGTEPASAPPMDGLDQWLALSTGVAGPRTEVLLNLIPTGCPSTTASCASQGQLALRMGKWKLLLGHTSVWAESQEFTPSSLCTDRSNKSSTGGSLPVTAATSPPWCPNGWVPPITSNKAPIPPPDVNCSSLPCRYPDSHYILGGTMLFDLEADPYEFHDVAAANPDVVQQLTARLLAWNASHIPQSNTPMDPRSNPNNFGGVWTPWMGSPDPAKCSNQTQLLLHSEFDGVRCNLTRCTYQGWAWDGAVSGGLSPLSVQLRLDARPMATILANVNRPGLVPKTGAPNPEHGFDYVVTGATAAAMMRGRHQVSAFVVYGNTTFVQISNSPRTICNGQPCADVANTIL